MQVQLRKVKMSFFSRFPCSHSVNITLFLHIALFQCFYVGINSEYFISVSPCLLLLPSVPIVGHANDTKMIKGKKIFRSILRLYLKVQRRNYQVLGVNFLHSYNVTTLGNTI